MKPDQNVSRALQSLWLKEKSEGRCLSICNFFSFFFKKKGQNSFSKLCGENSP